MTLEEAVTKYKVSRQQLKDLAAQGKVGLQPKKKVDPLYQYDETVIAALFECRNDQ